MRLNGVGDSLKRFDAKRLVSGKPLRLSEAGLMDPQ
jgi:hypothetical protein